MPLDSDALRPDVFLYISCFLRVIYPSFFEPADLHDPSSDEEENSNLIVVFRKAFRLSFGSFNPKLSLDYSDTWSTPIFISNSCS